ncbi:MAG TPA: MFS transporter [Dehalococcoidia bacterium]|nr:MFS transporter [Dehalococcoidia bacterium]
MMGMFYGWKLVGLALLITALAGGPVWNGVGVWVAALEDHFGWSRAELTGAFSMAQFQGSLVGPLMGYLIDKLGTRRMVFIGFAIAGLGFIIFSRTTNLPTFYVAYFLIMLGISGGSWLPMMTSLNKWFYRKRGMAMGIAGEGSFLGGLVLVPILAWAVTPTNYGWSVTALWIGVVFLVAAWPLSLMVRDDPADYGKLPDGESAGQREARLLAEQSNGENETADGGLNFTARQAIRTHAFWFITFGHALSSMLIATLTVHLVPLLTDQGMSLQTAAYVWAVLMGVGAIFQLIGGYLSDRLPRNQVLFGFAALQTAGFILAAFIDNLPMAILFAVVYGAGFGGRVPITTAIRGDYFGNKAFATITGISMAPLYLLMLAAPLFAAFMFDSSGSYTVSFLILGGLGSMSGEMFIFAKKPTSLPPDKKTAQASLPA